MALKPMDPKDIEAMSFAIITQLLGDKKIDREYEAIVKRCIHTSADFDYADNLYFTYNVVDIIKKALKEGCYIVTDTQMAKAGVNKKATEDLGVEVHCFIADEDVCEKAKRLGTTRAVAAMEKAINLDKPIIFAIGNAPTALIKLHEFIKSGKYTPVAIIAAPVGFVNVIESKELIISTNIPCIVAKGRKGGSNIAAAICNAIIYQV